MSPHEAGSLRGTRGTLPEQVEALGNLSPDGLTVDGCGQKWKFKFRVSIAVRGFV